MFFSSPLELVMLLSLGSGLGLPLGIPPAPEEPAISRVAPEECLFYMNWAGMAKPDPASRNQTEQLLAEKEVQECLTEIEARIMDSLRRKADQDPQEVEMVDAVGMLAKTVLTSPTAAFVSSFEAGDKPGIRGGALVSLGDKAAEVDKALDKITSILLPDQGAKPPAGPTKWRRLPPWPISPVVDVGVKGKYLILGFGEGEADKIEARIGQNPPAWLTAIRGQLAVPRPANMIYVNVAGMLKAGGPAIGPEGQRILEALGLSRVTSVASVTGLDDSACITKTHITVDGEMTGLLSVFTGKALSKADLAVIPKDATLAAAARFDLAKAYQELLNVVGRVEPRARDELLGGVAQFEEKMKINLAQDLFESVGDVWRIYNSPGEGGLVATGLTAVVNLRDHDRLLAANGKLILGTVAGRVARGLSGGQQPDRGPMISQLQFAGHTIFFLKSAGELMPFAPAWCITDKELIVALYPQNVKAYLDRKQPIASLAEVPAVGGLFAGGEAPMAAAYCDTPELFKLAYPIVQIIVGVASSELQREGVNIDLSILPSAPAIGRHLQPTVKTVRRTKTGILVESRYTLPTSGGGLLLPMWLGRLGPLGVFGLELPPTPKKASMNNLKQIMLAMLNYESTFRGFPAAAGPMKPGQPPVSWRVLILPYIDRIDLFREYHRDEPWDSANNKKLLARMPAVYKAPGSKVAAQGKTNYLAVVGDEYALSADKRRMPADITDGLSRTIMVVEASDEKAVPWTKPEDLAVDKKKPAAGLVGLRHGGFLAGFCDGSVQLIPAAISAETLHALFTRAGGEIVDPSNLLPGRAPEDEVPRKE
jgi:hypothetical protein